MTKEYLPLGTVVMLKNGKKPMIIVGYLGKNPNQPDQVFDYYAYPYPEGCMDSSIVYQFDQESIAGMLCLGYRDLETTAYLKALSEQAEDLKKKVLEKE